MKEAETREWQFLSNAATARLPAQQPKKLEKCMLRETIIEYLLGFIYYDWDFKIDEFFLLINNEMRIFVEKFNGKFWWRHLH